MPSEDLWTFQKIGERGTELTGYPAVSVYHDFRYHPKDVITGGWDDWMYDHRGVYAWTTELWSPQRQAGITDYKLIDWRREHPLEDDLKLPALSDDKLGGKGYVDWYEFEYPQFGAVDLGRWNRLYAITNPPPEFPETEIAPHSEWLVWHILISPRFELLEADCTSIDDVSSIEPDEPRTVLIGKMRQPVDRTRYHRAPGPLRCNQPTCTFVDGSAVIIYGRCVFGEKAVITDTYGMDYDRLMKDLRLAPYEHANKVRVLPIAWFYE